MVTNSWVFEGGSPFSLPAAWEVGSVLGGIRREVRGNNKKKKNVSGIFLLGSSA